MSQIASVMTKDHYKIDVILDNGSSITLNLESRLQTMRFGMLADKELFKQAITDGCCIRWDDKIEISLTEVFQLAQK